VVFIYSHFIYIIIEKLGQMSVPGETTVPAVPAASDGSTTEVSRFDAAWKRLVWVGEKVLGGMEAVGEVVAGILGLDESRFQYVIDGMDKADWQLAVNCENERRVNEHIEGVVTIESLAEIGIVPAHILEEDEEEYHPAPGDDDYEGDPDRMERGASENVPSLEMTAAPVASTASAGSSSSAGAPSSARGVLSTGEPVGIDVVNVIVADDSSEAASVSSSAPTSP
jgi:hypothetical protein